MGIVIEIAIKTNRFRHDDSTQEARKQRTNPGRIQPACLIDRPDRRKAKELLLKPNACPSMNKTPVSVF